MVTTLRTWDVLQDHPISQAGFQTPSDWSAISIHR
jgi:hypothetical protein